MFKRISEELKNIPVAGDLEGNVKKIVSLIKKSKCSLNKVYNIEEFYLTGADCSSLSKHTSYKAALEKAKKSLEKKLAKLPKPVKIRYTKNTPNDFVEPDCGDPCFPFCGAPSEVFHRQCVATAHRLQTINCKDVVIGLSGGVDSTLTLLVAYAAFNSLNLPLSGIHVYTMPGFGTTKRTRGNAEMLCEGLGINLETIDITRACRQHFKDIGHPEDLHDVVFENTQARERTQILMDKANQLGAIVLGTGDMSEIALGWSTYNGDHMSMFATNNGVPKTVVREVCLSWTFKAEKQLKNNPSIDKETYNRSMMAVKAVRDIVITPVSPELLPAKNGEITQKTEEKIGPYELHDFFMWHFCGKNKDKKEIIESAKKAFGKQFSKDEIKKWFDLFIRRLFSQSFKRNCAPDGIRIFEVYFSPDAWHCSSMMRPDAFV